MIQLPDRLKEVLEKDQTLYMNVLKIVVPFSDILEANDLYFFDEYTDHGINHINNTLQYAENLIEEETFKHLTPEEVGVTILSVVLHDIGMHTNAEMFKNMIEGKYDNLKDLFPNGRTWKELWKDFLYDSQYWDGEKKNIVFGRPDHNISEPNLSDLQTMTEYDKKLIGEFLRIHHCRIAQEVSRNGYMGRETIPFECEGIDSDSIEIAGLVARSHGMNVRDTFDHLEGLSGESYTPFGIHAVYLMVLLRLADYLQIDSSRTSETLLKINTMYSPYSQQEHKTHLSIKDVKFTNNDREKIIIQANPKDAPTYVKIEKLAEDIQKELDRSWAILGEVYMDYNYKLRYRRITSNISNEKFKNNLNYVPEQFDFRYNNDLFKLLIAPLYGDDPSYGVRELVQNAVDACRLCGKEKLPDNGEAHVKVEIDSAKSLFTITDRGKGMNLYEIKNYFLTIGSSYNDNIDWKKTRDQNHIYRTGRFGIGVLAAFLLGPEITVVTRKRDEATGYRFTASLNKKFIQIEKVKEAAYGTRIEIKCDEECIEVLGETYSAGWRNWYNWFIEPYPKVEYFYDGNPRRPKFIFEEYKELKLSPENLGQGPVYWKPSRLYNDVRFLYCNGFRICHNPQKIQFSLPGFDCFNMIKIPSLRITDRYNQLPLNLTRNQIDFDAQYPFEPELAKEVFTDLMCQLMAVDLNSYIDLFELHHDGFSVMSQYTTYYIKESNRFFIAIDRNTHRNHKSFKINQFKQFINDIELIDSVIRFSKTDPSDFVHSPFYRFYEINREKVESYEKIKGSFHRRNRFFYEEILVKMGCFAVLDDNTQPLKFLKQHFNHLLHSFEGWLIFAPSKEKKDQFERLILWGGASLRWIMFDKIDKSSVAETCIDDLFEKYMHKDPVVPYEYEERKKKFPLLFQEYSDIIEKYREKGYRD